MRIPLTDGEVDLDARVALRAGARLDLTPREVELLRYLARHPGVVELRAILTDVWGYSAHANTQAVHVAVRRLRAKLEPDPAAPVHLVTVAGVGWKLVPASVAPATPSPASGLVGRAEDLEQLAGLASRPGIVTVVGPGGIGKTRLVHALMERTAGRFVDLTPARTLADLRDAVLGGRHPSSLADDLVVLDNVEQVVDPCAEAVAEWFAAAPTARIVLTSRVALRLRSEQLVRLGPLSVADGRALFVRRSAAAGVDVASDPAVPALIEALEGNPLAIELAAARTPLLPPAQLLERGPGVLRSRARDRPEHHTSLDDVVAWSVNLLSEPLREVLDQLRVFEGGFTPEAAEAVVRVDGLDALDAVQDLQDASLLRTLRPGRLAPWVAVTAYLDRRGDLPEAAVERHLDLYTELGAGERRGEGSTPDVLLDEAANLRVALARALERGADERLVDLCVGVGEAGAEQVHRESADLIATARARIGPEGQPFAAYGHARALTRFDPLSAAAAARDATAAPGELGWIATTMVADLLKDAGRYAEAHAAAESVLHSASTPRERFDGLMEVTSTLQILGRSEEAWDALQQAEVLAVELGPSQRARCVASRANQRAARGDFAGSEADYTRGEALYTALGDRMNAALMVANLATTYHHLHRWTEAAEAARDAIARYEAIGSERTMASPLMVLGSVHRAHGRLEEAAEVQARAATLGRRTGNRKAHAVALCHLAGVRRAQGQLDEAATVTEAGISILADLGMRSHWVEMVTLRGEIALDRGDVRAAVTDLREAEDLALGLAPGSNARDTITRLRRRLETAG